MAKRIVSINPEKNSLALRNSSSLRYKLSKMKLPVKIGCEILLLLGFSFVAAASQSVSWVRVNIPSSATTIIPPYIESCNSLGIKRNYFRPSGSVYVMGDNFPAEYHNTNVSIFLVKDRNWTLNETVSERIARTATQVHVGKNGSINPTKVWSSPTLPGQFDIVLDLNSDGVYEPNFDVLDDNDVRGTAGLLVVPEFTSASGGAAFLSTFILYVRGMRNLAN